MKQITQLAIRLIPRHYLHYVSHFLLTLISPFFFGSKHQDPINGIGYRKLLSYGRVKSRKNALAPNSLSLERHRLLWLYLKEKTNFFKADLKLLHLAPEYCFVRKFKSLKNITYLSADLNSPWADMKLDAHCMPFDNNHFDAILANHLLEHVDDDIKVLSEFFRVLKPGGWGIFMVPMDRERQKTYEDPEITDPKERERHFWQSDHVRLYGLDYPERLRSVGFKVTEDNFVQTLAPEVVEKYCLPKNEVIYFCEKP